MTPRRPPPKKSQSAGQSDTRERLAALETRLETLFEGLPEKIGNEVARAVSGFVKSEALAEIEKRIGALEQANSFAAGAVKVEGRTRERIHDWLQTLAPIAWPIILGAVYLIGRAP